MATITSRESGVGLVELFLGSTVLAVAVLGTVGGLMTSLKIAIDSNDASIANDEVLAVVEEFRESAKLEFDDALATFKNRTDKGTGDRTIYTRIILDETRFDPPTDLNRDGDFDDYALKPDEVSAAYLEATIVWGNDKSLTLVTLVNRTRPLAKKRSSPAARPGN